MDGTDRLIGALAGRSELVPVGPGVHIQGEEVAAVVDGLASALRSRWAGTTDLRLRVPPVLPVDVARRTGYLVASPHLLVVGKTFRGDRGAYAGLVRAASDDGSWTGPFDSATVVLTPAACHGVYGAVAPELPGAGLRVEASARCTRAEATSEPGRLLSFEMLELVQLGSPPVVAGFVEWCLDWGPDALADLGLKATVAEADDPFFLGERVAPLVAPDPGQKRELQVALVPGAPAPVAVASVNHHHEHFTRAFGISDEAGPANSACLGFGLERLALALYGHHGDAAPSWPASVRRELGL